MASSYTPITASGGQFTATVLAAEFAKIKDSLDEMLHRVANVDNHMEVELDMNSHKIINVAEGLDPTDVATMANLAAVSGANVSQIEADILQLQTDLDALELLNENQNDAASLAIINANAAIAALDVRLTAAEAAIVALQGLAGAAPESHEINVELATPGSPVYTTVSSAASRDSITDLVEGSFLNLRWDPADGETSADLVGGGGITGLIVTNTVGQTFNYSLRDTTGSQLGPGDWEPGDALRFSIVTPAVADGAGGEARAQRSTSLAQRTFNNQTAASNAQGDATQALADAAAAQNLATIANNTATAASSSAIANLNAIIANDADILALQTNLGAESSENDLRVAAIRVVPMVIPFNGVLPDATEVIQIPLNTPITLLEAGTVIRCRTAPSGGAATLDVKKDNVTVATITIADGAVLGTIDVLDVSNEEVFAGTETLSIDTVAMNGCSDITVNFKIERQDLV